MKDTTKKVIDVYDTIAHLYANQYSEDSSDIKWLDVLMQKIPERGKVLDAGCGTGDFSRYLLQHHLDVTGIDYSEKMLEIARKKGPPEIFKQMDLLDLQFGSGEFDGILSSFSLIHVPSVDIPNVLTTFSRILKLNGALAIFAQSGESDHFVEEPFAPGKQIFFNFFAPERISELLKQAGFTDIEIHSEHCDDPYNMSDTNLFIFARNAKK